MTRSTSELATIVTLLDVAPLTTVLISDNSDILSNVILLGNAKFSASEKVNKQVKARKKATNRDSPIRLVNLVIYILTKAFEDILNKLWLR